MAFNSIQFFMFLPLVVILYYVLPFRFRWVLLLGASYFFYMCWRMEYVVLLLTSTLVDYICGLKIENAASQFKRRLLLATSIGVNLGILVVFKYFNFFSDSIQLLLSRIHMEQHFPVMQILLPIGISFYTFQTIGYTIDVYNGKKKAERHLGYFALYVAFFPQLVAGPIERAGQLLPQLKQKNLFNSEQMTFGLRLILFGFFKKLVIADRLAEYVDYVYRDPRNFPQGVLLSATFLFAFQIYCDFSGYTDIARGSARLLGVNLMQNFRNPYFAHSIPDFWRRWHISLSTWFRDYIYIPLGGSRSGVLQWSGAVIAVFSLSGLWHGAGFTFILWGTLHGICYLMTKIFQRFPSAWTHWIPGVVRRAAATGMTFFIVCFLWIFFRADSIEDARYIVSHVLSFPYTTGHVAVNGLPKFLQCFFFIGVLLLLDINGLRKIMLNRLNKTIVPVRWAFYYASILIILFFGMFDQTQFIYFQF